MIDLSHKIADGLYRIITRIPNVLLEASVGAEFAVNTLLSSSLSYPSFTNVLR